jgi:FKBP-type peptidyl-prolyl cis-trans isomerase FkpA
MVKLVGDDMAKAAATELDEMTVCAPFGHSASREAGSSVHAARSGRRSLTGSRFLRAGPRYDAPTMKTFALCLWLLSAVAMAQPRPTGAQPKPGTVTLKSGVIVTTRRAGDGRSPTIADLVTVHYRGLLLDSEKEFDSSYERGKPSTFRLKEVIPCWSEGLQHMKVGGKATLTCPPATAYGARGASTLIPPNATVLFEIELLSIPDR